MQLKVTTCPPTPPPLPPVLSKPRLANKIFLSHLQGKSFAWLLSQIFETSSTPQSHLGFFICFCRQSRDRLWSNGLVTGAGGNEKVGCGFNFTNICCGLRVAGTTLGCVGVKKEYPWPIYANNFLAWQRGQPKGMWKGSRNRSYVYILCLGSAKLERSPKFPSHSTRLNCEGFHVQPSTLNLSQNLSQQREPQTVRLWSLGTFPIGGQHPATIITPWASLPQDKWFDNCHKWKIGW